MTTTKMIYTAQVGQVTYKVHAKNKTEARQQVAREYRIDHPASAGIFLPFSAQRLEWLGEPQTMHDDSDI
jgi:hypothetical protein